MIQRNIRNNADERLHHIGRIQPPAHPHFQHRKLNALPRKILKRNRRHHLKKTGMPRQFPSLHKPLGHAIDLTVQPGKIIVSNLLAIYPNPLIHAQQMRRSIKPRPNSRCPQNRSQQRRRRPLAICPRNQHRPKPPLRTLQLR